MHPLSVSVRHRDVRVTNTQIFNKAKACLISQLYKPRPQIKAYRVTHLYKILCRGRAGDLVKLALQVLGPEFKHQTPC